MSMSKQNSDIPQHCPGCNSLWLHEDGSGANIIGIEYGYGSPERYDGVSEWRCQKCGYRLGRWTHQQIHDGELESRFGERGVVKVEDAKKFNDELS